MIRILEVWFLLVLVLAFTIVRADLIEQWKAAEQEHRELFLGSDGKLGDRCGTNTPCDDGMDCVLSVGRKVCLPIQCTESATLKELVEKLDLDNYPAKIMRAANLVGDESLFNATTMALGEGALNEFGLRHILRDNVQTAILEAMKANPLDLTEYNRQLQNCTGGSGEDRGPGEEGDGEVDGDTKAPTQIGTTGMGGLVFSVAGGLNFHNTFYYVQGSADPAGSIFSNICFGLGPQFGVQVGAMGGVGFTGTKQDLKQVKISYFGGVTLGLGAGFSNGYTIPDCVASLDFYLNTGVAIGGGLGVCFTQELASYEEMPSEIP